MMDINKYSSRVPVPDDGCAIVAAMCLCCGYLPLAANKALAQKRESTMDSNEG